jgi:heme-degrading monooxygenase HmoA
VYLKITKVQMEPNSRSTAVKIGEYFKKIFKEQKGFEKVYFAADDEKGEYISISILETKEDSDAVAQHVFPVIQKEFGQFVKGATTEAHEIVEI